MWLGDSWCMSWKVLVESSGVGVGRVGRLIMLPCFVGGGACCRCGLSSFFLLLIGISPISGFSANI